MSTPRIYFAGKMSQNDWRHQLVPDLRGAVSQGYNDEDLFNPSLTIHCQGFDYGGPFFVACDHGCYHGPTRHGVTGGCTNDVDVRDRVFAVNLARVFRANSIFAYIENADAFGTALEIGFAHAHDKPVYLGFANAELQTELWMSAHAATAVHVGSARDCWERFIRSVK